jgi:hypothetical protein
VLIPLNIVCGAVELPVFFNTSVLILLLSSLSSSIGLLNTGWIPSWSNAVSSSAYIEEMLSLLGLWLVTSKSAWMKLALLEYEEANLLSELRPPAFSISWKELYPDGRRDDELSEWDIMTVAVVDAVKGQCKRSI